EPPGGEPMRTFPPLDPDGVGAPYKLMNRGKTVVELDLKMETGRRAFSELIAAADVLVESYRPGVLDRLGFDRKTLERLNSTRVSLPRARAGRGGPADRPGFPAPAPGTTSTTGRSRAGSRRRGPRSGRSPPIRRPPITRALSRRRSRRWRRCSVAARRVAAPS